MLLLVQVFWQADSKLSCTWEADCILSVNLLQDVLATSHETWNFERQNARRLQLMYIDAFKHSFIRNVMFCVMCLFNIFAVYYNVPFWYIFLYMSSFVCMCWSACVQSHTCTSLQSHIHIDIKPAQTSRMSNIHKHLDTHLDLCTGLLIWFIKTCFYIYVTIVMCMQIHKTHMTSTIVCVSVRVFVSVLTYIYTCMYVYIYIYIYICSFFVH